MFCFVPYSSDESPTFRPEKIEQLRAGLRRKYDQSLRANRSEKAPRTKAKDMCLKLCRAAREHAFGTVVSLLGRRNQPLVRYVEDLKSLFPKTLAPTPIWCSFPLFAIKSD